jgi:hypothetical protein
MSTFTGNTVAPGNIIYASDHNTLVSLIAGVLNGNVDSSNLAAGAVTTGKIADSAVTKGKLDFSSGVWWEELGRTTLASAGDTISVTGLASKKYLLVLVSIAASGANNMVIRFNNDSSSIYHFRASNDGGADGTASDASSITVSVSSTTSKASTIQIFNFENVSKLVQGHTIVSAAPPNRREFAGRWTNNTDFINRIDIINTEAGDYAAGSEVIVLGHN